MVLLYLTMVYYVYVHIYYGESMVKYNIIWFTMVYYDLL